MAFLYNSNLIGKKCSVIDLKDFNEKLEYHAKLNDNFQDSGRWYNERVKYFVQTYAIENDISFDRQIVEIVFVNEYGVITFKDTNGKLIDGLSFGDLPIYLIDCILET